jgi:hypothetical protein
MGRLLTLVALVLSGVLPLRPIEPELRPIVGVLLDFDVPPGSLALTAMKKEVDSIFKRSGVLVGWRMPGQGQAGESLAGLVVVRFKGRCRVEPWNPAAARSRGATALAHTAVVDGKVAPYSEVECDKVRGALPYAEPGAAEHERQGEFGRAMGRVLAHELYHALARTREHAARGLARATQSMLDLWSGTLTFDERDLAAIRKNLARQPRH